MSRRLRKCRAPRPGSAVATTPSCWTSRPVASKTGCSWESTAVRLFCRQQTKTRARLKVVAFTHISATSQLLLCADLWNQQEVMCPASHDRKGRRVYVTRKSRRVSNQLSIRRYCCAQTCGSGKRRCTRPTTTGRASLRHSSRMASATHWAPSATLPPRTLQTGTTRCAGCIQMVRGM